MSPTPSDSLRPGADPPMRMWSGMGLLLPRSLTDIRTLDVIEGSLPRRALALVLEWASEHWAELMEDWDLCNRLQTPKKIAPLS
jgi:hypothetical protein